MNEVFLELPKRDSARPAIVINKMLKCEAQRSKRPEAVQQPLNSRNKVKDTIKELFKGHAVMKEDTSLAQHACYKSEIRRFQKMHSNAKGHSRGGTCSVSQRCDNSTANDSSIQRVIVPALPLRAQAPAQKSAKSDLSRLIRYNLLKECAKSHEEVAVENVDRMVFNIPTHIVAVFKDYLIYDDANEFLHRYYALHETRSRLENVSQYYRTKGKLWPSYVLLRERKVMQKGEERKQKIVRIKCAEELERGGKESTFFNTHFMDSLAKEDLSNSGSKLPAESLDCSSSTPCNNKPIAELLDALDQSGTLRIVSPPTETCGERKGKAQVRNVLNLYIANQQAEPAHTIRLYPRVASALKTPEKESVPIPSAMAKVVSVPVEQTLSKKPCESYLRSYRSQSKEHQSITLSSEQKRAGRNFVTISSNNKKSRRMQISLKPRLERNLKRTATMQQPGRNLSTRTGSSYKAVALSRDASMPGMVMIRPFGKRNFNNSMGRSQSRGYLSNPKEPVLADLRNGRCLQRCIAQVHHQATRSVAQISVGKRTRSGSRDVSESIKELSQRGIRLRPNTRVKERRRCMGITSSNIQALLRPKQDYL